MVLSKRNKEKRIVAVVDVSIPLWFFPNLREALSSGKEVIVSIPLWFFPNYV